MKRAKPLRKPWQPLERRQVNPELQKLEELPWDACYVNNTYQVLVRNVPVTLPGWPEHVTHISLKRHDRKAVHDWRDLQRIKNELCGAEAEAVEIYPAESRLMDTSNQYHLWVFPEGFTLPFGYHGRVVVDGSGQRTESGSRQRPFRGDERPADCASEHQAQSWMRAAKEAGHA